MAEYRTEEEQAEAVKAWLRRNGGPILLGIILAVALLLGWRWYQGHRRHQSEQASVRYEQLQNDLQGGKAKQAQQLGESLTSDYPDTPYAALGALALAQADVGNGKLTAAAAELRWVLSKGKPADLAGIARLRLARVLSAQKKYAAALKLVAQPPAKSYRAAYAEVRGDIEVAAGHDAAARKAYREALQANGGDPLLKMKLDNLGGGSS